MLCIFKLKAWDILSERILRRLCLGNMPSEVSQLMSWWSLSLRLTLSWDQRSRSTSCPKPADNLFVLLLCGSHSRYGRFGWTLFQLISTGCSRARVDWVLPSMRAIGRYLFALCRSVELRSKTGPKKDKKSVSPQQGFLLGQN